MKRTSKKYAAAIIILLALASLWRGLTFAFWKDDWHFIWETLFSPRSFYDFLHPAIFVEFMALAPVFRANAFWWQLAGIGIRILVALALMRFTRVLTKSKEAGVFAGFTVAAAVGSLDATTWATAHHLLWAALFLVIGLTSILKSNVVLSVLYLSLSLFCDPYQMFPIIFILPFFIAKKSVRKFLVWEAGIVLSLGVVGFFTMRRFIYGSQLWLHLVSHHSLGYFISKIYLLGNYFCSMVNLAVGWLVPLPEMASTGEYNKLLARVGFLLFLGMVTAGYYFRKTNSKKLRIVFISLFWMFLFYIPDWLFEPRLTMGTTHRYFAISVLGFVILVSYILSLIHNRRTKWILLILFLAGNIIASNRLLAAEARYRDAGTVNRLWNTITAAVGRVPKPILIFTGEEPLRTYALALSGGYPLAIARGLTNKADVPVVTDDPSGGEQQVCRNNVPLNYIFSFRITSTGTLVNESLPLRKATLIHAMDNGCVPTIILVK